MPRAFLIKKHHATSLNSKRRFKIRADADRNDGFHLAAEAKDYVKTSLASDSGSETCSTPSNSPSPQPYYQHHNYGFLKDDVPVNSTAAAAEWVARSSLNVYSRSSSSNGSVLEPLNMNASRQASTAVPPSAWIHAPLFPSYLPLYYSTLRHHQTTSTSSSHHSNSDIYYGYNHHPSSRTSEKSLSPSSSSSSSTSDVDVEDIAIDRRNDDTEDGSTLSSYCDISNRKSSKADHNDAVEVAINMVNKNHSTWNDEVNVHEGEESSSNKSSVASEDRRLLSSTSGRRRNSDGPRYNCPDCNKSYSTHSGLSKHQQFHCATNNKRSFSCKYCDKIYVSLGALKMHIRTHTLPCKCKLCGKAFSRPWLLQGHIRTHTGEKPFSCPHCNRAFADRSNLRAHLQTHSDIKKYSCKSCAKTFSRMSLLLKHEDGGCGVAYESVVINCGTDHHSLTAQDDHSLEI